MALASGARLLPLRHLSIRVPWHDARWNGTVCQRPLENASCLVLSRIRENRNDEEQEDLAGKSFGELAQAKLPPCVGERVGFMAPYEFSRTLEHPYAKSSSAHQHFAPTPFRYPKYSAACIPFRWALADESRKIADEYQINLTQKHEDNAREVMGFDTEWLQDKRNQLAMLDTFFSAIEEERSLCFFYAKRTPLSDDPRRVIVGVGRVLRKGPAVEYRYSGKGPLQSMLWERSIEHSIRPDVSDGFLLPYHQILDLADKDQSIDPATYVVYAPDDHWQDFAYTSEHVSHDAAIAVLLACNDKLREAAKVLPGDWETPQRWIDARLNELWRMRGPYPGLGSALTAFGLERGNSIAYDIASAVAENEDPWPMVDRVFNDPASLNTGLEKHINAITRLKWNGLSEERRSLLKLLARFDLSATQTTRFYQTTEREKARIFTTDGDLLTNPYLLYELDRNLLDPIPVSTVDRGVFPDPVVREAHPLPAPSALDGATDPRRVRAQVVSTLEMAAGGGDTLWPRNRIIQSIRDLAIEPKCPVDEDLMQIVEPTFGDTIHLAEMADGARAYQLWRLSDMGRLIRSQIDQRLKGKRHDLKADWAARLAAALPYLPRGGQERQVEERAREEKVAALEELAASRLSVLIGPAGTGKTTLLSVLCGVPEILNGGIRLLAPTGKARVQLEKNMASTGLRAQTIAQFLLKIDRYDPQTGSYRRSDFPPEKGARTVIIDEASMLTEEQLGAVLNGMQGVDRLILVGDPQQLPPIGSGRPFVDIVARVAPADAQQRYPRVSPGYAELTIRRRQQGEKLDDLLLAEWFGGQAPDAGADEIWDRLASGAHSKRLRLVAWQDSDDLRESLLDVLVEELGLNGRDDAAGFERSLGGAPYGSGDFVYFWPGKDGTPGAAAHAEDWQILSPVRGQPHGVSDQNRLIQRQFRARTQRWAITGGKVPRPAGPEDVTYGDKVICTRNQRRQYVYPSEGALQYVANGEIGVVVGEYKTKYAKYSGPPRYVKVEFSSQPGYEYSYGAGEFGGDDGDPPLELAYCITIHKSQGSEFKRTILILPNPCRLLSRELLYTALTRQQDRLIILHQGDLTGLKKYADGTYSETARRLTNLFRPPKLIEINKTFLEAGLIHRTLRNEPVRSKSEVIIADHLANAGLDYVYEQPLTSPHGGTRYPDFTVDVAETGLRVYWEHLGMLQDPAYQARWIEKLTWYRAQGILPHEDGGGSTGTLVTTRDDELGGISSASVKRLVQEVFGL